MRQFETGATRNDDSDQLDYEGFMHPYVIETYAKYMHENRVQADGKVRDSGNWQKGIELDSYMKSGHRHFMDWWKEHRGEESREGMEKALCGLLFNTMGYLYQLEMERRDEWKQEYAAELSPAFEAELKSVRDVPSRAVRNGSEILDGTVSTSRQRLYDSIDRHNNKG